MHKRNEILIATKNKGKLKDFATLLPNFDIKSLFDFEIDDIEETGETFSENALIKAKTLSILTGKTVIADDSGLACEGLDGAPGVYSQRYSVTGTDMDNNKLLLKNITGKNRSAKFVSVICIYFPSGEYQFFVGELKGRIVETPRGSNGFGYDPIFYIDNLNKTMAEITQEEKNKISHRRNAMMKLLESGLL